MTEKLIRLIEQADEMDSVVTRLEDDGAEYCEPDELEARLFRAYEDQFNACMALTKHLRRMFPDKDIWELKAAASSMKLRERYVEQVKATAKKGFVIEKKLNPVYVVRRDGCKLFQTVCEDTARENLERIALPDSEYTCDLFDMRYSWDTGKFDKAVFVKRVFKVNGSAILKGAKA